MAWTSGETQVREWMPLVTDLIGSSSTGTSGQTVWKICRLTLPCSFDTPLLKAASRRPLTAMLNGASGDSPGS